MTYPKKCNVCLKLVVAFFCCREHFVASVRHSNVYLVVINATCGKCDEIDREMGVPGEPRENIL